MSIEMGFCQEAWNFQSPLIPALALVIAKRKFRWELIIPDLSAESIDSLPPLKSARPSLSFKEENFQHLNEVISYPVKPEWQMLNLTLYDIVKENENPVFSMMRRIYDPKLGGTSPQAETLLYGCSYWRPILESPSGIIPYITLNLYDGCGCTIEQWIYEGVYVQSAEFGDLDMNSSDVVVVDAKFRYQRAYINLPVSTNTLSFSPISNFSCTPIPPISQTMMFSERGMLSYTGNPFINLESQQIEEPEFKQIIW